jgi:asparagine synthase (glutamine-hydrolysing)
MFAFAYIDLNSRQIILARDAFGIKPLYFAQHKNAWAFASEPQMLTLLPGIGRDINKIQAFETIRYGDQISINRNTIFSKVQKLLPGEKLVINLKSPSKFEWQEWYRPKPRKQFEGSFSDAVSEFKKYFVESVRLQMKSEVQIGAGLSGGLDSSSVVAAMHLNGGDKINITTVSHIAQSANKSEEKWVDIFNQSYKTVSRKTRPKNDDLINEIDSLILHQGEPFGTTSIYAQHCVYRKAKEINLTVMLEGQGADELLGGYDYYLSFYLLELFKTGQMHEFFRRLTQIALTSTKSLHLHLIRLISLGVHPRIVDQVREISGFPGMPNWVQKCELKSYYSRVGPLSSEFGSTLQGALIHTLRSSLVNLFRYCDRNSMAFSVEARVPFMSLPLVNFIHSLPAKYLIGPNGETKYILRSAMRGLVPDLIIDRPDKIGFENDEQKLLVSMTPWVEEALQNDVDRCHLINRDRLRTSWNQFKNGRYSVAPRLWYTLIMLRWFSLNKTGI